MRVIGEAWRHEHTFKSLYIFWIIKRFSAQLFNLGADDGNNSYGYARKRMLTWDLSERPSRRKWLWACHIISSADVANMRNVVECTGSLAFGINDGAWIGVFKCFLVFSFWNKDNHFSWFRFRTRQTTLTTFTIHSRSQSNGEYERRVLFTRRWQYYVYRARNDSD